ncbi:MAG: hypothetical protein V4584_16670 [Verrucomicrobiota bacterium]
MKIQSTLALAVLSIFQASAAPSPALAGHDFFYAGENKVHDMFLVKKGEIVWSYHNHESRGEISDAVLLSNGSVLFSHQFGITLLGADKKVIWKLDAPEGTEIHTAQPIGRERIVYVLNSPEAKCVVLNIVTGKTEREFPLQVGNPKSVHGHFRHARLTAAGTLLVAHMDGGKVSEYDDRGKEIWTTKFPGPWAASRLPGGNTLISSTKLIREVNPKGETVWECGPADLPDHKIHGFQIATRLANGNTLLNNWVNPWDGPIDFASAPAQALEITPEKKVVWTLRSWGGANNLGPSTTIQLLDTPTVAEDVHFGEFR